MTEPYVEVIQDENGDEMEHGEPDYPGQDDSMDGGRSLVGRTPRCIFPGCVSTDRHSHGGFPGGYDNPDDPEGPPIEFTTEPAPGVRDYNGALLAPDPLAALRRLSAFADRIEAGESPSDAAGLEWGALIDDIRALAAREPGASAYWFVHGATPDDVAPDPLAALREAVEFDTTPALLVEFEKAVRADERALAAREPGEGAYWFVHGATPDDVAREPGEGLDTLRLLRYLWDEADIGDNHKVCDLFSHDDPLAVDIEAAIAALPKAGEAEPRT